MASAALRPLALSLLVVVVVVAAPAGAIEVAPAPRPSRLGIITAAIDAEPDANLVPAMRMSSALNATLLLPTEVKAQLEVLQIIEIDELRKSFKAVRTAPGPPICRQEDRARLARAWASGGRAGRTRARARGRQRHRRTTAPRCAL